MKTFIISAHHTFPAIGGNICFSRPIIADNKDLAIKAFFDRYGLKNKIDRIIEAKENDKELSK